MKWKVITTLEELSAATNSLQINSHITINHPQLKQELMERKFLKLGLLEIKLEEGKIMAALPLRQMPHIID